MRKVGHILWIVLSIILFDLKGQDNTAAIRLDIVLNPIVNVTVHPDQHTTTLEYNTLNDYRDGVEVTAPEQLSVFSTGPYALTIRLADPNYNQISGEGDRVMYLPDVRVTATPTDGENMYLETQSLTTMEKTLVSDDKPALHRTFNINYKGPGGNAFVDFVDKPERTIFTNTLIYSIEVR